MAVAKLILWDEAPRLHGWGFKAVERLLWDIAEVGAPFGGTVVGVDGDFRPYLACAAACFSTADRGSKPVQVQCMRYRLLAVSCLRSCYPYRSLLEVGERC